MLLFKKLSFVKKYGLISLFQGNKIVFSLLDSNLLMIIIIVQLMSVEFIEYEAEIIQAQTKRKLELCKSYSETGYCVYGDSCFFAHGVDELVMYQPTLRKKMCRNYHQHRYCKFGSRCNFVHDPKHSETSKKAKSMLKMME